MKITKTVKNSPSRIIFMIFNYIIISAVAILCLLPILHVFMGSLSDPALLESNSGIIVWPLGKASLLGYKYVLQYRKIWIGYRNTIFYVVAQCFITGLLTVIGGYVLSRKRFHYRNVVMAFISFTMLFNGGMVPTYMVVKGLGLTDTYLALLIPSAMSVFNIIIMRTAIAGIPDSLEESACLDGAGEFTIMFKIILPLCKATFAVLILFTAVGKWNEWFSALLYLSDEKRYPLQMFLRSLLIKNESMSMANQSTSMQMYKTLINYCAIMVATIPILCAYPFAQKYFVHGVMIGSVKG